ncbi:carbohydrate porin [uncultured Methylobacterium sp.]|jgi:porin|uniref:carbohydrate porin n=1 Tax=uncultured Methylobacterium sp. TaxID=157278 RepID=UPI00263974C0|nr:carbohydrate porin [uncultured Methylobacterium sp.]
MSRGRYTPPLRHLALAALLASGSAAIAQSILDPLSEAARIATEGLAIGSEAGAGGDPQTSVAQPVFSAQRSAEVTSTIQDLLGPAGDPGGYRAFLRTRGITYDLIYFAEAVHTARGGMRRGTATLGLVDIDVDVDLDTFVGWRGAAFHTTFYQIHGSGASRSYIGNLLTLSDIEALSASRLNELWLEQNLFEGRLAVRVGQLATDTEYMVSQTSILFTNGSFGWAAILANNLRGGGPSYPLASPGVRVKVVPNAQLSFQAGLYDGDPGGPDRFGREPDPQRRNRSGIRFPLTDPALAMAEISYAYNIAPGAVGEPGTVTLGGWYQFGRFNALSRDAEGRSLVDPTSSGVGRRLRGNNGVYGLIDQTVYREPNDPNDGASVFLRVAGSPGDRNLIDLYLDAGIAYRGLFQGRSDDTMGLAVGYAQISGAAHRLDVEAAALGDEPRPRRSMEAVVEATYQAVLGPGVALQPSIQYVFKPSGGISNPRDLEGARIRNAAVFGLRATVRY